MLNPQINLTTLSNKGYKIYARHLILEQIGINGQKRLKKAKILCVGAGGLASSALFYLAASGIGSIGIIDDDQVELSNLQRQILYTTDDIGIDKIKAAKQKINKLNPDCNIQTHLDKLQPNNASHLIAQYDLVVDSCDNFETRLLVSYICFKLHKVHIYGAIQDFEGQISVFNYKGGPNYYDLYHKISSGPLQSCNAGVIGTIPGTIGIMQATEAIKIILGVGEIINGYLLIYNALEMSFKRITIRSRIKNFKHAFTAQQTNIINRKDMEKCISVDQLAYLVTQSNDAILIIDVRQAIEFQIYNIQHSINIPLKNLRQDDTINHLQKSSQEKQLVVCCSNNSRSILASKFLSRYAIPCLRLTGGIEKWKIKHFPIR